MYVDEAACYLLPFLSRTWAPRGQTPVITEKAGRDHLSLIAAMAPNGRLYVGGQDAAFNGADVVWFLEKLCRRYRRKNLLIIWDGATIHKNEQIKSFLRRKKGRIHLQTLPAYSPELNPVELLWSQLKRELKNQVYLNMTDLADAVLAKVEELRNNYKLISSFFHKREVGFFTN